MKYVCKPATMEKLTIGCVKRYSERQLTQTPSESSWVVMH